MSTLTVGGPARRVESPGRRGGAPQRLRVLLAEPRAGFRSAVMRFGSGAREVELVVESVESLARALEAVPHVAPDVLLLDAELKSSLAEVELRVRSSCPGTLVLLTSSGLEESRVAAAPEPPSSNGHCLMESKKRALRALLRLRDVLSRVASASASPAIDGDRPGSHELNRERVATLTRREREVLGFIATGIGKKQVAYRLGLSVHTVNRHVTSLMTKLDIHDRVELARFAIRAGLVDV